MDEILSPIGLPILCDPGRLEKAALAARAQQGRVLAIVTATKPCFYKLGGLMQEAVAQGLPFFILHSGQHHDDVVGHGWSEFGFAPHLGVDLRLRGDLSQKAAELCLKMKRFHLWWAERWPDVIVVPYVNGDTVTAAYVPGAWLLGTNRGCIQGEAALRAMSPAAFARLSAQETPESIVAMQWGQEAGWVLNRTEPFPEQYDTFVSAAGCDYFFAPVALNAAHLEREGYAPGRIDVVGNTIVDAIRRQRSIRPKRSVFEEYPKLRSGEWLRVDVHRRENLNRRRFLAIVGAVADLVERGHPIAFIELTATRRALEKYGLRDQLVALSGQPNFLFTPVWKEYAQVVEFLESDRCWGILTDSGSMQEEMNELGKPCLTARFSTDRPETVMAKGNLLVPPLDAGQMVAIVEHVRASPAILEQMRAAPKLYGSDVSRRIIARIRELFARKDRFFTWAHDRLEIYTEEESVDYL